MKQNATNLTSFTSIALLVAIFCSRATAQQSSVEKTLPNIIIIFVDDLGYGDIGPFGSKTPTPNLDRMAREGRKFTDFIVASAVCSASRAALLTGCIHERVSISGALGPNAKQGLSAAETTIAEICRQRIYATKCIGKWHLGHHPKFLPTQQGFDSYFGLPYSNDMWPLHPDYAKLPADAEARKRGYPKLPLIENDQVIDAEVSGEDQSQLTKQYTERAVQFIEENRDRPFFLYLPHTMVHVPLFVSEQFRGKSDQGLFGDVMMEIDWSVGQIFEALKKSGVDENTLVIFTSDNGPWLSYGDHAGSAAPLREGKGTSWEGGVRVPTVMRWPNRIPAATVCDQLASTIDLLPTIANILGSHLPDQKIDGKDILALMTQTDAISPHESFPYYYANNQLQAIRDPRWKLILPHTYRSLAGKAGGSEGTPSGYTQIPVGLELYDLKEDIGETKNVAADHPDIVNKLQNSAEQWRDELGDSLTKRVGKAIRRHGQLTPQDPQLTW
jgi:arylsulfatase A